MGFAVGSMRNQIKLPVLDSGIVPFLSPHEVTSWLTLQRLTLGLPGLCTEADLFYHHSGDVFVSDVQSRVLMAPGSRLSFDTAFNILGLQVLSAACRIGRLALALAGTGQVEVTMWQSLPDGAAQRVMSDIVTLDPNTETLFEVARPLLNRQATAIWAELHAVGGAQEVWIDRGRFLTDSRPEPSIHLAICRPNATPPGERPATDGILGTILDWAALQEDKVSVLTCGPVAEASAVLITLPPAGTMQAAHLALLTAARLRGFSHVLMVDADVLLSTDTLDRTLAGLSILRDPRQALGAGVLGAVDPSQLDHNGLVRGANGKLRPLYARTDLRIAPNVLQVSQSNDPKTARILPQTTFLAFSLSVLGHDPACALIPDPTSDLTFLREGLVQVRQIPGLLIRRDTAAAQAKSLLTLQNMIFPEQSLCTELQMYFHGHGPVAYDEQTEAIVIEHNAMACFDTYFNALSIGKWHQSCHLNGLLLGLTGQGRAEVKVFHAIPGQSWEVLATTVVTLSPREETRLDLSHYGDTATRGMIFFEVRALSPGVRLTTARYMTEGVPDLTRRLALSITTFRREAQVQTTARRLAHYFDHAEYADQMDCFIIDNGDSAQIPDHPKIRRIVNANLGGAGGFTRGLLEAEASGYSHVLFMDDDAAIPMEALHRTYMFLCLAKDPKAAVAGAMINNTEKWRMAENGAVFDRKCHPKFGGTDLRSRDQVFWMENESAQARSAKMYGGWWFFAFPVAQVKRHPFPFFVRGDDVNFSLANGFAITTLNGVVSFAEDFVDKESPLNWYLDLRSHMVHHLTLENMRLGRLALAGIGLNFFRRNLLKFQYESIEAILMAWVDVLKGPDYFASNADAATPRAAIKALTKAEVWQPVADVDLIPRAGFLDRNLKGRRKFYPWSLNGHFLPLFGLWGSKRVIPAWQRSHTDAFWGSVQLTFLNATSDMAYVTRRSNLRAARLIVRMVALYLRTVLSYDVLQGLYKRRYPEITTQGFWRAALNVPQDLSGQMADEGSDDLLVNRALEGHDGAQHLCR